MTSQVTLPRTHVPEMKLVGAHTTVHDRLSLGVIHQKRRVKVKNVPMAAMDPRGLRGSVHVPLSDYR